jgi:hypothetical protein
MIGLRLGFVIALLFVLPAARAADPLADGPGGGQVVNPYSQYSYDRPAPLPQVIPAATATNELPSEALATPAAFATDPNLSASEPIVAPDPLAASPFPQPDATRLFESTWYTRIDYFSWTERLNGATFVKETGVLPSLGYMRRSGRERYRVELFGSKVNYKAAYLFDDGFAVTDTSKTDYLGTRLEYDLMYEPERFPGVSFFGGLGSRFWIRNLPDDQIDATHAIIGYQEVWWTFYPYIGMETRRTMSPDYEFFWRGRIGMVAFTYEHVSMDDVTLYPRQGFTTQLEAGVRGPHLFISANFEAMQFSQSATVDKLATDMQSMQPRSQLFLLGLKTGVSF